MADCGHEPAFRYTRPTLEGEKLRAAQSIELVLQQIVEAKAPTNTHGGKEKDDGGR